MRTVDNEARKRQVLFETINEYIRSANAVSSETLKEKHGFKLSSATLRNCLAELEEEGFLVQPHTSAGRIPTDKGYRYYLEFLMQREQPDIKENEEISLPRHQEYVQDLEAVLENVSEILAQLTHYASIVSSMRSEDKFYFRGLHFLLEQPEFNDIQKWRGFLTVLEERARLAKLLNSCSENCVNIYIGRESHFDEMEDCSLIVSTYSKKGSRQGKIGVLGPKRMNYSKVISILEHLSERLNELLNEE
ncbi:MAG: hypothetical protein AB1629_05885 [Candidatus Omnitrophota bacterium]